MLAVTRAGRSIAVRLAGGTGSAAAAGAAKAGSVGIVGGGRRIRGVALFSSTRGGGNGQGNKGGWNRSWSSRIGILAGFGGACALGVLAQSLPRADCQAGMSGGAGGSPCPVRGHAKQEEGAEDPDKDFLTPDQLKALPAPGNSEGLPIYTRAQVAEHSVLGEDTPVWVIYKDGVYDITEFISGHPGGAQKIMLAAGKGIEPYWRIYQQHFNTKFALETLAGMRIGTVDPTDMLNVEEEEADPYASDPVRSDDLIYHGTKPCNAETPAWVHADNYITPNDLFYVRHHSPVPEPDMSKYRLEVEGQGIPVPASLTLEQIKALPKREVTVTIQCAGNRRSHFESVKKTQGIGWDTGAISTAVFGGVYLRDVLSHVGLPADYAGAGVNHIHFVAVDEVQASIPSDKAMSPAGDVLLAYEMNGEDMPRDHGAPIRAVVPGHVGVRNVKWVKRVVASPDEAEGMWQKGPAYKGLSPNIKDLNSVDPHVIERATAVQELPVQSVITSPEKGRTSKIEGGAVEVKGWAWSGGGRGIVRVDVTADGGKTWQTAELGQGSEQKLTRAWAWTFWRTMVPVPEGKGEFEVAVKATDASYNTQVEDPATVWNIRGLNCTAWHRRKVKVAPKKP